MKIKIKTEIKQVEFMEFQMLLFITLSIFILGMTLSTLGLLKFIEMIKDKGKDGEGKNSYKLTLLIGSITTFTSIIILLYLMNPTIQPLYLIILIMVAIAMEVFLFRIYLPYFENWMIRKMKDKGTSLEGKEI